MTHVDESVRAPYPSRLSPKAVADLLLLEEQEVALLAGVDRDTLLTRPESPRVQEVLCNLVELLSAALAVQADRQRAASFLRNEPIAAFGHKTLLQLVRDGRTADARRYLESVSAGFTG